MQIPSFAEPSIRQHTREVMLCFVGLDLGATYEPADNSVQNGLSLNFVM